MTGVDTRTAAVVVASPVDTGYRPRVLAGENAAPTGWGVEPIVVGIALLTGFVYGRGARRIWRRAARGKGLPAWRAWCYVAGSVTVLAALLSPIHAIGGELFSVHMVQHELLMLVAAPLLVLGRPLATLMAGLPLGTRRAASRVLTGAAARRTRRIAAHPATAWMLFAVTLWVWHVPALWEATIRNEAIHAAQHASFVITSMVFWSFVFAPGVSRRRSYGWGVPYIFGTALHGSVLAALLTVSSRPWYSVYIGRTDPWGLTALQDQHLAGLLMWVPPGVVYLSATLFVLGIWLATTRSWAAAPADETAPRPATGTGSRAVRSVLIVLLAISSSGCEQRMRDPGPERPVAYGGDPEVGRRLVREMGCGSCHAIPGVRGARGLTGPPLTSFAHRAYIGGRVPNTPENLVAWIVSPKSVDPGTAMPAVGADAEQALHMAAYLYTLR